MADEQRKDEAPEVCRDRLNREFAEKFPRLASFGLPGPWDEKDDIFFETVTGEPVPREDDEPRHAGL
jgi:hypothetical protein